MTKQTITIQIDRSSCGMLLAFYKGGVCEMSCAEVLGMTGKTAARVNALTEEDPTLKIRIDATYDFYFRNRN